MNSVAVSPENNWPREFGQDAAITTVSHHELQYFVPDWATEDASKLTRGHDVAVYSLDHVKEGGRTFRRMEKARRKEGCAINLRHGRRPEDFDGDRRVLSLVGYRQFDTLQSAPIGLSNIAIDHDEEFISFYLAVIFVPKEYRGQHYGLKMATAVYAAFGMWLESFIASYRGNRTQFTVVVHADYDSERGAFLSELIGENINGDLQDINEGLWAREGAPKLHFLYQYEGGF